MRGGLQPEPGGIMPLARLGSVDLIVLGSGAAGLTAALTALLEGLRVAVLEIAPVFGGTTARSSGTAWIPDNPVMRAAGFPPDRAAAESYLAALMGEAPSAPLRAFLDAGPQMIADLESRADIRFRPYMAAPDYRGELPGAAMGGRALEPVPFDGRLLGKWFDRIAPPLRELTVMGGMMVTRAEAQRLIHAERSFGAMAEGLRLLACHGLDRLRHDRGTRLVMGNGLVARLFHAVLRHGGLAYPSVHVEELIRDGGVCGVAGRSGGDAFRLRARKGVVLAGGGFPSGAERRARWMAAAEHSPASPFATGGTIDLGLRAGAALGERRGSGGFWFPSSLWARPSGGVAVYPHIALDRAKPGSLIVDGEGSRFANEALSYHDFCLAILSHGEAARPCWLIADRDFIRRYGLGVIRPRTPSLRRYLASGYLRHGSDPTALAAAIKVPPEALRVTLARMNGFAQTGVDEDFGRGETPYQRANGDAARGFANPCLGPIGGRDLYAVALHPTPLATARGLVCSPQAEVLDADGHPLGGLYAAGNDMQSCFGGDYPGAGAQIGPAMTFGWLAARHAAQRPSEKSGE